MMLETDNARFLLDLVWQQLWIGAALVLFVSGSLRTTRHLNAATRHWTWALTLLTAALLPLPALLPGSAAPQSTTRHLEQEIGRAAQPVAEERAAAVASGGIQADRNSIASSIGKTIGETVRSPAVTRWVATSLLVLWLVGTLWMLLRLLGSARVAARMRRESRPAPIPAKPADIRLSTLANSQWWLGCAARVSSFRCHYLIACLVRSCNAFSTTSWPTCAAETSG